MFKESIMNVYRFIKKQRNLERFTISKYVVAMEVVANGNRAKHWKAVQRS